MGVQLHSILPPGLAARGWRSASLSLSLLVSLDATRRKGSADYLSQALETTSMKLDDQISLNPEKIHLDQPLLLVERAQAKEARLCDLPGIHCEDTN